MIKSHFVDAFWFSNSALKFQTTYIYKMHVTRYLACPLKNKHNFILCCKQRKMRNKTNFVSRSMQLLQWYSEGSIKLAAFSHTTGARKNLFNNRLIWPETDTCARAHPCNYQMDRLWLLWQEEQPSRGHNNQYYSVNGLVWSH